MSQPSMPASKSVKTETPILPISAGSSVTGQTSLNSAPRVPRRWMLDRATRLLAMSPQIAIFKPSIRPIRRRMVKASRRAWVGCSWRPSPALITAASTYWLSNNAAPEQLCRTTRMSGCIALSVVAVSSKVSPFLTDEPATAIFRTDPPSRFAASSNETRVRVELS